MTPEDIIAERAKTHGDYSVTASIAQSLKRQMRAAVGWHKFSAIQQDASEAIQGKLARALSGDPNAIDHWRDITGYAQLVVDDLEGR